MRIGVVGCGNISDIYLANLTQVFSNTQVVAVCDQAEERAHQKAEKYNIPQVMTLDQMLNDPQIEVVLNITIPKAHYAINKKALESGKHVYCEKPLCITDAEAQEILALAQKKGLRIGCAPDTILGAGIQTCKEWIERGEIGAIIGATGFMTCPGHEWWHPDPEFYYQKGGGPLLDMGPYYLTALTYLIGGISGVQGMGSIPQAQRAIHSEPKKGQMIHVETPTHISALMAFDQGCIGTMIMSFDTWYTHLPYIELYGSKGSLCVPDPNSFGGPVWIRKAQEKKWNEVPLSKPYETNSRGLGLSEMIDAIEQGIEPIANGEMAAHVLEVMNGILACAEAKNDSSIHTVLPKTRRMERSGAF